LAFSGNRGGGCIYCQLNGPEIQRPWDDTGRRNPWLSLARLDGVVAEVIDSTPVNQEAEMMNYIVAFDFTDPAVAGAATVLTKTLTKHIFVDVNQHSSWPAAQQGCTLYIIDHGSGRQFGDESDANRLLNHHFQGGTLRDVYKQANKVVLVACSTADQAQLIFKKNGFQARTFAQNLKAVDKGKTIVAAVGPVYAANGQLHVVSPTGVIGFGASGGWVTL